MVNFERPRPKIITPEGQRHQEPKPPQKKAEQKPVPKPEKLKPAFVDPEPARMMKREVERPREVSQQLEVPKRSCTEVTGEVLGFLDGFYKRHRKKAYAMHALNAVLWGNIGYQEIVKPELERREQMSMEAQHEKRVDEAHDRAAAMMRADDELKKEFTPQQIDAMADALESYSSKAVFEAISGHSGVSMWEIAAMSDVKEVRYYSDVSLLEQANWEKANGSQTRTMEDIVQNAMNRGAMHDGKGIIHLNLSSIVRHAGKGDVKTSMADVLLHENMHGFGMYRESGRLYDFYEGQTELFSNIILSEVASGSDTFHGYSDGQTAAASVVYESLDQAGQRELWRAYLFGDKPVLVKAYDAKFGEGSFQQMLDVDELTVLPDAEAQVAKFGIKNFSAKRLEDDYRTIVMLEAALARTGDDWEGVARRANTHLGAGIIIPVRGETMNGVVLTTSYLDDQVSNGLIRLEGARGTRLAMVTGASERGDELIELPGTNAAYLRVDLDGYSRSRVALQDQSFQDRGAPVVKALKNRRQELLAFKEM